MRPRFVGIHYWFQNESGNRFTEARAAGVGTRVRLHLRSIARSQTEQVGSPEQARKKIQRLSAGIVRDGLPSLVRETDNATPGQVGNYVVDRYDNQAGVDFSF